MQTGECSWEYPQGCNGVWHGKQLQIPSEKKQALIVLVLTQLLVTSERFSSCLCSTQRGVYMSFLVCICTGQNTNNFYYTPEKLLPFFILILMKTFSLSVATWMSWLVFLFIYLFYYILFLPRHFLFAEPAFLVLGWARGTSALHSLQVLLINSSSPNSGSVVPVPRPGSACYLSFGSMCWSSLHTFILQFSA